MENNLRQKNWSSEDDAILLRRFNEGTRIAEIASELGRSESAVKLRLRKLGCSLPTPAFIIRARSIHPNSYKPWSAEEKEMLRDMYGEREKIRHMSEVLGRGVGAIARELERQDL